MRTQPTSDGAAPGGPTVLRGGTIVDGSGSPPVQGDVAIQGDRILAVGGRWSGPVGMEISVTGQVVAPGFVDLHTHSDISLLSAPDCISAVEQGITTQQVGLCGHSAAPLTLGGQSNALSEDPIFGYPDVDVTWTTVTGYLDAVRRVRPATNVMTLVGHNTIRRETIGLDDREATTGEVAAMVGAVGDALAEGAAGFSSGLTYVPGTFAGTDELVALVRESARGGRPYHTHMRYRRHGHPGAVRASLEEAISTAAAAGARLNVSHLYPHPGDAPDEAERLLAMIEDARRRSQDVTFDVTVFTRGGGAFSQQLPAWAKAGGAAEIRRRMADLATRRRLLEEMTGADVPAWKRDWGDRIVVKTSSPQLSGAVGRSLAELGGRSGRSPLDVAFDLLAEDPQVWLAAHSKRQADLEKMLAHPVAVPVTDGLAAHPERHRSLGLMPKTFGTFPHYFGFYVRERAILPLAEGVRRATALPAERMGLTDRGRLATGWGADITTFNPSLIANQADDVHPWTRPSGIGHVFVNGVLAVRDGVATGARGGRVL
jgi:N-acyl-D-amino-acid deacylase